MPEPRAGYGPRKTKTPAQRLEHVDSKLAKAGFSRAITDELLGFYQSQSGKSLGKRYAENENRRAARILAVATAEEKNHQALHHLFVTGVPIHPELVALRQKLQRARGEPVEINPRKLKARRTFLHEGDCSDTECLSSSALMREHKKLINYLRYFSKLLKEQAPKIQPELLKHRVADKAAIISFFKLEAGLNSKEIAALVLRHEAQGRGRPSTEVEFTDAQLRSMDRAVISAGNTKK